MSLYEYRESKALDRQDVGFYSLIMAAMRKADDQNLVTLRNGWPNTWAELQRRYDAPGGLLPGEVE